LKKKTTKKRMNNEKSNFHQSSLFFNNILFIIVSIIVIIVLYKGIGGYKWLWDSLIVGNLNMIKQYRNLTIDQKYEIKCGFDYKYVNYIKSKTPEDAIILMPSREEIYPEGKKSDFNEKDASGIKNKAWATYFLYPRKLVYEEEKDINQYYECVNYIAIVNYFGYDRLNYSIRKKEKYHILPVNAPNDKQ